MLYMKVKKGNPEFFSQEKQFYVFFFFFFFFCLSRAAPAPCGGSQARGCIGAVAAGLYHSHSHSNATSEPRLQPTPQLMAMPVSEAWDQTLVLIGTSWVY